jgi:hypothetical protein
VNISPREYEADKRRTINPETYRKLYGVGVVKRRQAVSVLALVYMLMDTFLPAVVLLTLGSIGLALVNLNAEKM